ncbi:MAG: TonB family protein [Gemmatimonadaceae bacterium]
MHKPISVAAVLLLSLAGGRTSAAQDFPAAGTVTGFVRDESGAAIVSAQVRIAGTALANSSDERGAFRITSVPAGSQTLNVRRLGFQPAERAIIVEPGVAATVQFVLAHAMTVLDPVRVEGRRQREAGFMAGFYSRRRAGIGKFITREDIERIRPSVTTDLLRMMPAARISYGDFGRRTVTFRNSRCTPTVWMDGSPAGAAYFDPDLLDPRSIEAIEVYPGAASVPMEFRTYPNYGTCGVILVWFRHDRPARRNRENDRADLSALLASRAIYAASDVDSEVVPLAADPPSPRYPDSLYQAGIDGLVVLEFVVDTQGRVETGTIGVVSSTHPLFSEAAVSVVHSAEYLPARRDGRLVRQLVRQPFSFVTRLPDVAGQSPDTDP